MIRKRWPLAPLYPDLTISQRQAECLITLLRHPYADRDELAQLLEMSPRTFDTYTHVLYKIFGCKTRRQLMIQGLLVDWRQWEGR